VAQVIFLPAPAIWTEVAETNRDETHEKADIPDLAGRMFFALHVTN
jgi:hypothetical protein